MVQQCGFLIYNEIKILSLHGPRRSIFRLFCLHRSSVGNVFHSKIYQFFSLFDDPPCPISEIFRSSSSTLISLRETVLILPYHHWISLSPSGLASDKPSIVAEIKGIVLVSIRPTKCRL